jgi:hypothetical protein
MEQIKLQIYNFKYLDNKLVILLDEISIMKCIVYNKTLDVIEGFEDIGTLGRSRKIGSHILVVVLRGIYANWNFPLFYFLVEAVLKVIIWFLLYKIVNKK